MSLKHTTLLYACFKVITFFFFFFFTVEENSPSLIFSISAASRVQSHDFYSRRPRLPIPGGKKTSNPQVCIVPPPARCWRCFLLSFLSHFLFSAVCFFCFVLSLVTPILLCSLTTSQGSLNITAVGGRQLMKCYSWFPKLVKYLIKTCPLHEATHSVWLTIISVLHLSH